MSIGKYIRNLLEDRTRVILPGFGNLEVVLSEGTGTSSGRRIAPPGLMVRFDAGYSKDDGLLAEALAAGELLEREEAQQRVLELVDAIKFSLDKGQDYQLPETGTFSRDADGRVFFHTDPAWVLEPDQYGLESMDLLELEELPAEGTSQASSSKEKTSSKITELTPPKPKPKSRRWRVIWLVAAALIVVLVVLILIPSGEDGDAEWKKLFDRSQPQQVEEQTDASADVPTEPEEVQGEQEIETQVGPEDTEMEEEEVIPAEETDKFFIIAGSFSRLNNASDLQDQLRSRGYNAEVMITENRMYRVSVASFAAKDEAENALVRIKSEAGMESCWLLSN